LKEERRLSVRNYGAGKGPQRDEVTGEWKTLHIEELYILSSPNIIRLIKSRSMRWAGHVAHMGERIDVYRVLMGRPDGNRPLGRSSRRWDDNIKMVLEEFRWECRLYSSSSGQEQVAGCYECSMNFRVQ